MAPDTLSRREARRIALTAQGLLGPRPTGGPAVMLRRLRAVQIDTISVLARSHELVAYARFGPISRRSIEEAYWAGPPFGSFEYWAHAACVLPIEDWPLYEFKREPAPTQGDGRCQPGNAAADDENTFVSRHKITNSLVNLIPAVSIRGRLARLR